MKNNSLQSRSIYHDLLRIFATFAVICIHICGESCTWEQKLFSDSIWNYLNIFDSFSRFSVPVFVMISGSFMLEKFNDIGIKTLYKKNVFRLICAFIVWNVFYTAFYVIKYVLIFHQPIDMNDIVHMLIEGDYHMWFIPMIIFLYAVTPFLYKICSDSKSEVYFLILASIPIFFGLLQEYIEIGPFYTLYENAGMEFVSGYTVPFVLGHYLTKQDITKKYRIVIYLLAIVSLLITIVSAYIYFTATPDADPNKTPYVYEYLSPNVLIMSVALFILFKYNFSKIRFSEKLTKAIIKLSSLTFGIYLVHLFFVKIFLVTPVTVESIHPLISVPLLTLIVFVLSAFTSWVISKIPVLKKYII